VYYLSLLSRSVLATSSFLFRCFFPSRCPPPATSAPSLRASVPSGTPIRSSLSFCRGGRCFYNAGSRLSRRFFFCFGGGRPFHKDQSLLRIPLEIPNARFPNSIPMVFLKTLLPRPIVSSRGRCLLRPPILLAVSLPNVSSLDSCTTLALVDFFLAMFLLCHATFARWSTFLRATANSFRCPNFLWV
jgi:hypothetical protein